MQCDGVVRFQHDLLVLQAGRKACAWHGLAAGNTVRQGLLHGTNHGAA